MSEHSPSAGIRLMRLLAHCGHSRQQQTFPVPLLAAKQPFSLKKCVGYCQLRVRRLEVLRDGSLFSSFLALVGFIG